MAERCGLELDGQLAELSGFLEKGIIIEVSPNGIVIFLIDFLAQIIVASG